MIGKRIGTGCLLVLLLFSCIGVFLPVSAEKAWTAAVKIERISENKEDDTITVRVSVEQITSDSGIFCAVYNICYDNSVLELISWENSKPEGWNFSGSNPDAEDWTRIQQAENSKENYLMYTLLNADTENGVKEDGVLYTDLHFKVLSDEAETTVISVTDIQLSDVTLVNQCRLPDQRNSVNLRGDSASSGGNIRLWITVDDITDPAGVSSIAFHLQYDTLHLKFIRYECLLPNDWSLLTEFTEDQTQLSPEAGEISFNVINSETGRGVKESGVLGLLVEFAFAGTEFDPSLLSIGDIQLMNDEVLEMTDDSYRLAVRYEYNGEVFYVDEFLSADHQGRLAKILIAVISVVVILAIAVAAFLVLRKKKLV